MVILDPASELYFWTGIIRDHAEFMLTALSSREPQTITSAQYYKNIFISLRNEVKKLVETQAAAVPALLINQCITALTNFISFQRFVERRQLECCIEINMTPSSINFMLNEADEFYQALCLIQVQVPVNRVMENIHLHRIWLMDASGHAQAIGRNLDGVETGFIKRAEAFIMKFQELYLKAEMLGKALERACLTDGALEELNREAKVEINKFICLQEELLKLRKECRVLGIITPLVLDHMIREEKYYLALLESLKKISA